MLCIKNKGKTDTIKILKEQISPSPFDNDLFLSVKDVTVSHIYAHMAIEIKVRMYDEKNDVIFDVLIV